MFMAKRETLLKEFDKVKSAMVDKVSRIPRMEDFYVAVMQKMGESAVSLSDVFGIGERNCLKKLMDDFMEESEMSLRARQYFMVMVAPHLMPQPSGRSTTSWTARAGFKFLPQTPSHPLLLSPSNSLSL